jgi:hypothetical protein
MSGEAMRKGGGGKLSRSETVTVRLDPKLRYLAELAARSQRRTLSSYIEWAVVRSLSEVILGSGSDPVTVADEAELLWDVDVAERFVRLAARYPELLSYQEQETWKLLNDSFLLLPAQMPTTSAGKPAWDWRALLDQVVPEVRRQWPTLMMSEAKGLAATRAWVEGIREQVAHGEIYPHLSIEVVNHGPASTDTGADV